MDERYSDSVGALLQFLCQGRRRGLRNIVVNRAVVRSQLTYRRLYPVPAEADRDRLRLKYPDRDLAEAQASGLVQRRLEPLLAAAHIDAGRRRILLDCRGMPPRQNGSAQCVLGFLDGFAALDCSEQLDILVWPDVAMFHRLGQRYPNLHQVLEAPSGEYFAAVSLTQPWLLRTVAELHRHSLVLAVAMLDTIAWDVLYPPGTEELGTVWRFIARHSDGLLYNSHFTRERFNVRFPLHRAVVEQVTHHSLVVDEFVHPAARTEPVSDYVLIFGNEYEHKDVRPTLRLLVDAFPFNQIVAFGIPEATGHNVRTIPSGDLGQAELHRLIAGARVIVFPSFYEGFGLPVVEGLAYGRPVIVRRSPLWAEIAGWSRLPGSLIEFDDAPSLVESVGRVLAGLPGQALPSGAHLATDSMPPSWRDCAARVIALLDTCLACADGGRWREREESLRLAGL
jgi:glycosyltransferase involved in cell wall biosynthesis